MRGSEQRGRLARLEAQTVSLWQALADPTRRRILDLLIERPQITGEIAASFDISRIAVMRHLDALARAALVTSRKRGRRRWHYVNLAPLQRIHQRWFDPHAAGWASGLLAFQDRLETEGKMTTTRPTIDIALDLVIEGPPGAVFAALARDPGGWWGHPMLRPQATGLTLDGRLGGLLIERWAEGGAVLAVVTGWADDAHLQLSGPFHLGVALGVATFDLSGHRKGTRLEFSFRAVGAVDPELVRAFSKGWSELITRRLKAMVETGERLGIAADSPPARHRSLKATRSRPATSVRRKQNGEG